MTKLKSLLIFNLISITLGSGFTLFYDYYQKNKLAEFIITSQRNNIIVRDIAAFAGEISALSEIFFQVKIVEPVNAINIFKIEDSVSPRFTIKITKGIFNNKSFSDKILDIEFYYSLTQPLTDAVVLWILISIVLSPIFLVIQNRSAKQREIENESKINSKYAELARQVAHDIRSPLTALRSITSKIQYSNSEEYQLVNDVFNRITAIADNLLNSTRKNESNKKQISECKSKFDVAPVIQSIVREKSLGLDKVIKINFDRLNHEKTYCIGDKIDFQGLLSNILQNAIESKVQTSDLAVNVFLRDYKRYVEISIIDNGCGIPEEIVQKLTTKEFTYNKEKGNGLGLYHAKKCLAEWGGELKIFSQLNTGTQIDIRLLKFL